MNKITYLDFLVNVDKIFMKLPGIQLIRTDINFPVSSNLDWIVIFTFECTEFFSPIDF